MNEAEEEIARAEVFHGEHYAPETITRECEKSDIQNVIEWNTRDSQNGG